MVTKALIFEEYCFVPGPEGTDWLEGHQMTIEKKLGKGLVLFHNKRGGILMLMFGGDLSKVKKAEILLKVEELCGLQYIKQREAHYKIDFLNNLKWAFGDNLVIK